MLPGSTLWKRIEEFRLDAPGAEFPFSSKLQRETGWDPAFVQLAIQEYKKFTYLACVAGHPVSPSKDVDQVWHLHLTYTRSYWEEFCPKVLERPLHHELSSGGADEDAKYQDWYARTLESYERIFEEPAPEWIWPPSASQVGAGEPRKEKDMSKWCGLLKALSGAYPAFLKKRFIAAFFGLFLIGGCAINGAAPDPFDYRGPEFLIFFWTLTMVLMVGAFMWRESQRSPEDDGGVLDPSEPYLVARLASTDKRPFQAALVSMQARRIIAISNSDKVFRVPQVPPPTEKFERGVYACIGPNGLRLDELWQMVRHDLGGYDQELGNRGLLVNARARWNSALGFLGTGGLLVLVGVTKVSIGLSRNRPVDFLVMSTILVAVFSSFAAFGWQPRRTRRGDAYLERTRAEISFRPRGSSPETVALALGVALLGEAFMPSDVQAAFRIAFPPTTSGGGGCGSSCGGGGCGGGGCGGCGGG